MLISNSTVQQSSDRFSHQRHISISSQCVVVFAEPYDQITSIPMLSSSMIESSASMLATSNGVKRRLDEGVSDVGSSGERELCWEVRDVSGSMVYHTRDYV
jgi:hypothetical protein